ncbi:MAG: tetratricopeptide repeat protein [Bacteroidales bacterium]|nr:tetratricopeptide repeat protein [Bacteroidales bacterium]
MKSFLTLCILGACVFLVSCDKRKVARNEEQQTESFSKDTAMINRTNLQAIELLRQRQLDSTLVIINRNLEHSVRINYTEGIGFGYWYAGVVQFYQYRYDTALYLHQKACKIYEDAGNKEKTGAVLYSMMYDYSLKNEMMQVLESGEKARKLFEETGDYEWVYDCVEALIYAHRQLHHTKEADSLIIELVNIAEKTGNKKRIANSYYNLGSYYIDQAYLNLAIEAFYKALRIAEESGDSTEIANALGSVGLAYLRMKEYKNAIKYYLRQEKILKNQVNQYELSVTYSNLGESYNALGDYTTGLSYHLKTLEMRKAMNFQMAISNSLQHIGHTYLLMKDSAAKALEYINQSLDIDEKIGNFSGIAKSYMLAGKIYVNINKESQGIQYLEKSIELARKYEDPYVTREASEALVGLYTEKKHFDKAFANLIINNQVTDSLESGDNVKRITQLEMQHAFRQKQNEIEVTHLQEKIRYESTIKRNRLIMTFSVLLISIVALFVVFLYRSYRKSRKAEKEKEALLKEMHHRVKNNLMVISSLLNLQSGSITDDVTLAAVKESQGRVKSMALIHQQLYQSERFSSIDFPKYLEQLMASLHNVYGKSGENIQYVIRAEDIRLDIDTAIPLGLITNELATNAYKYGFTENTSGLIEIDFNRNPDKKILLRICDNGKGFPEGFDLENSPTLGLKLVKLLTKQIKARLYINTRHGAEYKVVLENHL